MSWEFSFCRRNRSEPLEGSGARGLFLRRRPTRPTRILLSTWKNFGVLKSIIPTRNAAARFVSWPVTSKTYGSSVSVSFATGSEIVHPKYSFVRIFFALRNFQQWHDVIAGVIVSSVGNVCKTRRSSGSGSKIKIPKSSGYEYES